MVNVGGSNFGLIAGVSELGQHHAPGVDDHAVSVTHPFLVVSSGLDRRRASAAVPETRVGNWNKHTWAAATTYDCVSIARALDSTSQCALPVGTVKAEGKVMMSAPRRLRAMLISGNRS